MFQDDLNFCWEFILKISVQAVDHSQVIKDNNIIFKFSKLPI